MQISTAEGPSAVLCKEGKTRTGGKEVRGWKSAGWMEREIETEKGRKGVENGKEKGEGEKERKRHEIRNAGINFPGRGTKSILQYPQ